MTMVLMMMVSLRRKETKIGSRIRILTIPLKINPYHPLISTSNTFVELSSMKTICLHAFQPVLRRFPLLPKLKTLRLPDVTLMNGQIDALKDTLTKCPNLVCLELAWFAGYSEDIPMTISPDSVPKLKHITAHLYDVLNLLSPHRPIESITLINTLIFADRGLQSIVVASHKARQLRRLRLTLRVNMEEEKAAVDLLAEIFTKFPNLEEFLLTMDSAVSKNFVNMICELVATHTIRTIIRVFKYYPSIPGRYAPQRYLESEERRLDELHCNNHLTRRLRSCCPNLKIVVVQEKTEYQ
ncbi:hypothetical protein C8Q75DRAFT_254994 [Abortiporus biennis]|nr:hypothetical protein C8Q75DRAFT_254994 [Abortiporus biennis]